MIAVWTVVPYELHDDPDVSHQLPLTRM